MTTYQSQILAEFEAVATGLGFSTATSYNYANTGDIIVYKGSIANVIATLNFMIDHRQSKILMDGASLGPGRSSILWNPAKIEDGAKVADGLAYWTELLTAKVEALTRGH
jgi:hypothetical protein